MSTRRGEFVTPNEPPIFAESLLDPIVMEDGEDGRCLADSAKRRLGRLA
jgi:hypothetical protein